MPSMAGADADAGADHDGELAGEILHVLGCRAESEMSTLSDLRFGGRSSGGGEREDVFAARSQLLRRRRQRWPRRSRRLRLCPRRL